MRSSQRVWYCQKALGPQVWASIIGAALTLVGTHHAYGFDECGASANGGTVTCTSAGNPYASGIAYSYDDFTLNLQSGVNVVPLAPQSAVQIFGGSSGTTQTVNLDTSVIITSLGAGLEFSGGNFNIDVNSAADISATSNPYPGGGFYASSAIDALINQGNISIQSSGTLSGSGEFSSGISVGTNLGDIDIITNGQITTTGEHSPAIGAGVYTIGSGGAFTVGVGNVNIQNSAILQTAGADSHGIEAYTSDGDLTVNNDGDISTTGDYAHGVLAHVGTDLGSGGSGNASIANNALIQTSGLNAFGVSLYLSNGSHGTITNDGDISATGTNFTQGILVSSDLGLGSTVTINNSGIITGGQDFGGAIYGYGLQQFVVNNAGTLQAVSDTVINAANEQTLVSNTGEIIGRIETGNPYDASTSTPYAHTFVLTNETTGVFTARGDSSFGSQSDTFNNLGLFRLADSGGADSVSLDGLEVFSNSGVVTLSDSHTGDILTFGGNFTQVSGGVLSIDVDPQTGQADLINVTGTASLAGTLRVNQINAGPAPGFQEITILHADGGITDNGITIVNTGAITYSLLFPNPNDLALALGVMVDFAPDGMNRNQTALGNNVNAIQAAGGSSAFQPVVTALSSLPDVPSLAAAYNALSPELYLKTQVAALFSSLSFADNLMSCRVRDGGYAIVREGQCIWAEASGRFLNQDQTRQSLGFDEDAWRFAAGAQFAIAAGTHINVAAGYENGALTSDSARADVDRAMAGIAVKHQMGPLMLSAALTGGYGWHDDKRALAFDGFSAVARADHDVSFVAGRLRAAWLHQMGGWYVKPMADIDVTLVRASGVRETGGGGAALSVASQSDTFVSFSPAIEIGSEVRAGGGLHLRPYARAGMTVFSDTDLAVSSQFLAAPAGVPGFSTLTQIDRVVADVSAGVDLLGASGMTLRLGYDGRFGDTMREHSIGAKATFPF